MLRFLQLRVATAALLVTVVAVLVACGKTQGGAPASTPPVAARGVEFDVQSFSLPFRAIAVEFGGEHIWVAVTMDDKVVKLARDGAIAGSYSSGGWPSSGPARGRRPSRPSETSWQSSTQARRA